MVDFSKLDKIIHERGRLAIMTLLATRLSWPFQELKQQLDMSDGNLVTHLRSLHDHGYVAVTKEKHGRVQTSYSLTKQGRETFESYLKTLEEIIKASRP